MWTSNLSGIFLGTQQCIEQTKILTQKLSHNLDNKSQGTLNPLVCRTCNINANTNKNGHGSHWGLLPYDR